MNKFIAEGALENPLVTTLGPKLESLEDVDDVATSQFMQRQPSW